jgi:hypothetical protein
LEVADRRVGEIPVGVAGIRAVAIEKDVSVDGGEGRLILPAPVQIDTGFERVRARNLRDVVGEFPCVIEIAERRAIESSEGAIGRFWKRQFCTSPNGSAFGNGI